jgi:pimeloyl-ACP methyl ester carboxylesterase
LFAQDPEASAELNDLKGLDLKLYTVYRPASWGEGERYPLVTWGNGTCAQPEGYAALLRYVASQGFVVVAPNSRYVGSGDAQKRGIDFMLKANADSASPYFGKIDETKVAAMGHSQGSMGTVAAAGDARIKTVILFNGGTTAKKPFFGFSGERDIGNPTAASYRSGVNAAAKAAFIFFHMVPGTGNSDGHLTLMLQPERVVEPTAHWLKMMLNDDADSKLWFVGDSCKLCGHATEYDFGQKGL